MMLNPFWYSSPPAPPPGGDPYYDDTVLILNGDGADGGTTITDDSPLALVPAANTGVVTSTTTPKFGSASLSCAGTNAIQYAAGSQWAFGNGDFTVEYWIHTSDTLAQVMGMRVYEQAAWNVILYPNRLYWQRFINDGNIYSADFSAYYGVWTHVAHVRSGTTHKMYFNGVEVSSITDSYNYNNSSRPFFVGGMSGGNSAFDGRLEIRITKGVARYTSAFTPPTEAFPTS